MTTDYHTAISSGATPTAALFNAPLGELDAAVAELTAEVESWYELVIGTPPGLGSKAADYHTPITTGAAANAATFNVPMAALDEAIGTLAAEVCATLAGGSGGTDHHTPITTGANANADTFNAPYSELDAAIVRIQAMVDAIKAVVDGADYEARDDFTDTLAAGAVDGTDAQPGPGERSVTDSGSNVTVGSGLLSFAGGTSSHVTTYYRNSVTIARAAGQALVMSLDTVLGSNNRIGLSSGGAAGIERVYFYATDSTLRAEYRVDGVGFKLIACGTDAAGTYAIVLRNEGAIYIQNGNILWVEEDSNYDDMTAAASCYSAAFDVGFMRAPSELFPLDDIVLLDTSASNLADYPLAADGIFDFTVTAPGSLGTDAGLVIRKQDGSNYWRAYFDSAGAFKVERVASGTPDGSSPYINVSSVVAAGETRTIRVIADGTSLTFWTADGPTWTNHGSVTDSYFSNQSTWMPAAGIGWTLGKFEAWKRELDGDAEVFMAKYGHC